MKKLFISSILIFSTLIQANTFPTNNPDSINLYSHNFFDKSFDANSNGISIKVPVTEPNVTIEVFDGDITAPTFTANLIQQDPRIIEATHIGTYDTAQATATENSTFNIYVDPDFDGINPGEIPIATLPSTVSMDSVWATLLDQPNRPDALAPNQTHYGYYIEYTFQTSDGSNHYKYRSNGDIYVLAYNSIGINSPAFSAYPQTSYGTDGDFILRFTLEQEQCFIDIVDGDFDITNDSEDENTPSNIASQLNGTEYFNIQTNSVLDEAANMGQPQDDSPILIEGTLIIDGTIVDNETFSWRRSPNVQYLVSGPEFVVQNLNPSGNQELELFRIKSTSAICANKVPSILPDAPPDDMATVDAIPAGDYYISVLGLDKINTIFLAASYDVTSVEPVVCQSGQLVTAVFEHIGDVGINVLIKKRNGTIYFDGYVEPGELVPISGADGHVLRGNVDIYVNGIKNVTFKTPCSGHFKGELIGDYFSLRSGITNNRQSIE